MVCPHWPPPVVWIASVWFCSGVSVKGATIWFIQHFTALTLDLPPNKDIQWLLLCFESCSRGLCFSAQSFVQLNVCRIIMNDLFYSHSLGHTMFELCFCSFFRHKIGNTWCAHELWRNNTDALVNTGMFLKSFHVLVVKFSEHLSTKGPPFPSWMGSLQSSFHPLIRSPAFWVMKHNSPDIILTSPPFWAPWSVGSFVNSHLTVVNPLFSYFYYYLSDRPTHGIWKPYLVCREEQVFCSFGSFGCTSPCSHPAAVYAHFGCSPAPRWHSELQLWLRLCGVGWHSLKRHRLIKMMTNTVAFIVTRVSGVVQGSVAQNILSGRSSIPSRAARECARWLFLLQSLIQLDFSSAVHHTPCYGNSGDSSFTGFHQQKKIMCEIREMRFPYFEHGLFNRM